jgi:hypothetical protein
VVDSALSALSNQLDASFLTACWLPAFVAVFANAGLLALLVGPTTLATWATDLDAVEQGLAALLLVVVITLLALLLRALDSRVAGNDARPARSDRAQVGAPQRRRGGPRPGSRLTPADHRLSGAAASSGSRTVNVAPAPGGKATVIAPPWAAMISRAM